MILHNANTLGTQRKTKKVPQRIFLIYNLINIYVITLRLSLIIYLMIGFHNLIMV